MGLSPGAPRGAPEARANLSASGGKGNTAKSKIVSIAPPLLSPASGGAARRLAACGRCFSDSPQRRKIAFLAPFRRPYALAPDPFPLSPFHFSLFVP